METIADLLGQAEELLDRGEYGAVVALLEPAKDGGNPEVLCTLGLACYRLDKYQEAIEHLSLALSLKPNYILALARRGMAYQELGQQQAATADFEQALTFEPQDHHDWRGWGIALNGLKKHEEAIASFDKAIEIKPDNHDAWNGRGVALGKLGRYEEAIASYDRAIEIKPDKDEAWHNRGVALGKLGRYEEAIASYNKAIEIKPDYHLAWNNRGIALGVLGKHEEAIASYDKAIEIKPDKDEAWYNRGTALRNLGRNEEAIASYNKAIEIKPDDHFAWNGRGGALGDLGRYEDAIASYDKAIEIKPDDHNAWKNRGSTLDDLGRYEEAIASFNRAIEIKPDYYPAWHNRGNSLDSLGRNEESLASYEKALEIKPNIYESWYGRGKFLFLSGRLEDAIVSYDRAIEIKPDFPLAWQGRGIVLGTLGRYEEAVTSFEKAIELKPDFHEAWKDWRICESNRLLSLNNWLKVQQHCLDGLKRISFEKEPMRHLIIWQYYLWVCSRTRSPQEVDQLAQEAGSKFSRYLAQNPMSEWKEQRLREQFAGFKHLEVSILAQAGKLEEALKLAEEHRNFRMGSLIDGQGYRATATTFQQAQQLLTPDTAIIYWHYSPLGFTTFVLRHGQPLQLLHPPATKPQGNVMGLQGNQAIFEQLQKFEQWLQVWQQNYAESNKLPADGEIAKSEHSWQMQMQKEALSLKSILNIQYLINEHLGKIKNLILIPHRDLHLLPLHSLFPFQFTTTYLPSLQVGLNLQNPTAQTPSPLLNIHQPTGSPYIEIAQALITAIHDELPLESHPLPSLNKEQFLALLGKRHRALQFTGHGSYNSAAPEKSAIQLPDGEFRLLDFRQHPHLDLSSYQFLCLTACESGITTQSLLDEYVGWSSAFLAKKARAVISTLWNVDVRSSALLMVKFHEIFDEEIFNEMPPKSAPVALREAQEWLSSAEYADVADWYIALAEATPNIQHGAYLRTEADRFRNDGAKIDSHDPKDSRPFWNPYHWAGFICTGLLSG